MIEKIRLGTRGSALARWQTDYVAGLLHDIYPDLKIEIEIFTTQGDKILDKPLPAIGGKGLFTAELEAALHAGTIDLAVHSLKDLPTESPAGLTVGGIPVRERVEDVLVSKNGYTLDTLPQGAIIGTSSRRRAAQLKYHRPDLVMQDIRGNVDTRVRKALEGEYDAIMLAGAGLTRLGKSEVISQILPLDVMLPAPGQGALGIQCRDEAAFIELLAPLTDKATLFAVTAERAFLAGLGGGCSVPIAAYAWVDGTTLYLQGRISALDGSQQIDVTAQASDVDLATARTMGQNLSQIALDQGASALLVPQG